MQGWRFLSASAFSYKTKLGFQAATANIFDFWCTFQWSLCRSDRPLETCVSYVIDALSMETADEMNSDSAGWECDVISDHHSPSISPLLGLCVLLLFFSVPDGNQSCPPSPRHFQSSVRASLWGRNRIYPTRRKERCIDSLMIWHAVMSKGTEQISLSLEIKHKTAVVIALPLKIISWPMRVRLCSTVFL